MKSFKKSKTLELPCSAENYLVFLDARCANALPAAVLDALPVLPLRSTFEAALAALAEVCLLFLAIGQYLERR